MGGQGWDGEGLFVVLYGSWVAGWELGGGRQGCVLWWRGGGPIWGWRRGQSSRQVSSWSTMCRTAGSSHSALLW